MVNRRPTCSAQKGKACGVCSVVEGPLRRQQPARRMSRRGENKRNRNRYLVEGMYAAALRTTKNPR